LLSVAAVSAHKGHDVLVRALGAVADLPWHCRLVGSLDREPAFVAALRADIAARGLDMRIEFAGPRVGAELEECYATADLLVLASRGETYGMVLAEALAHGVPVLASDVGGVREALGPDRRRPPGLLVPSGDPAALVAALRRWLTDARLRAELRSGAVERRDRLTGWDVTAREVAAALAGLAGSR
jgi:glycosyltransferase involved in cell wall biosynthesis